MPVEDTSVVVRGLGERQEQAVAFSPWHGLAAHQPSGGVNRARKPTTSIRCSCAAIGDGCPVHELRVPVDRAVVTAAVVSRLSQSAR